jgi:hypothetical protein
MLLKKHTNRDKNRQIAICPYEKIKSELKNKVENSELETPKLETKYYGRTIKNLVAQ